MEKDNTSNPNPEVELTVEADESVETNEIVETSEFAEPSETIESSEAIVEEEAKPLFAKETNSSTNPTEPKPKKKIGLIIAICVAAVLLIGGGVFAAVFMIWRQSDDVVIMDAVTGALKQSKSAIEGTIDVKFNKENQDESGVKSMKFTIDGDQDGADMSSNLILSITTADDTTTDVAIGGAFVSDGAFYVKIDGIKKAIENIKSELPEDATEILGYLEDLINEVDGEWYKISVSDLNLDNDAEEAYDCMVDAINKSFEAESQNELVELYKEHQFLISNKQDGTDSKGNAIYNVSWDAEDLADFLNGMADTSTYKSLSSCSNSFDASDTKDITASDVAMPKDLQGINLHIDSWSHELRGISVDFKEDGNELQVELFFLYEDKVNVEIPSDAKSVKDLMGSIEDAIKKIIAEMLREQVIANCNTYGGTVYYSQCIASVDKWIEEYLEDIDLSELFSLSTGNIVQET